jgi:hypothetical protein
MLDDNTKTVDIAADGGALYQLHNDGMIWRYTGTPCAGSACPGWHMLDDNPRTTEIAAGGGHLYQLHDDLFYQLHTDGTIWRYTARRAAATPARPGRCSTAMRRRRRLARPAGSCFSCTPTARSGVIRAHLLIPGEVARESGMMSPANPI